jgi:hypothetical protein
MFPCPLRKPLLLFQCPLRERPVQPPRASTKMRLLLFPCPLRSKRPSATRRELAYGVGSPRRGWPGPHKHAGQGASVPLSPRGGSAPSGRETRGDDRGEVGERLPQLKIGVRFLQTQGPSGV